MASWNNVFKCLVYIIKSSVSKSIKRKIGGNLVFSKYY